MERYSRWVRLLSLASAVFTVPLGGVSAAVVLDWSAWDATFDDGRRNWQSFTNSDGIEVRYRNHRLTTNGSNGQTDFLFGTPAIHHANSAGAFQPFNGTGGAPDHYLDIYQEAGIGNGSRHRFRFDRPLDGASVQIWDIDSSVSNGRNYTDQVQILAFDSTGASILPTRAIVTNTGVVQQIGLDTWAALPDAQAASNSTDGNLIVFFDAADVFEIEIRYVNADGGVTNSPNRDSQAIGIYDIEETGQIVPPVVPEPRSAVLAAFGFLLIFRRRRGARRP